jgi:hypothetical protein
LAGKRKCEFFFVENFLLYTDIRKHTFDEIARFANALIGGPLTADSVSKIVLALQRSPSNSISYDDFLRIVKTTVAKPDWERVIQTQISGFV